jgi:anti-sigma regulatory factor (Ser/Thr protein kinase)
MLTILTISRDETIRHWLISSLSFDHRVIGVPTVEEALQRIAIHPVDAVLVEAGMARECRDDLLETLARSLPVIAIEDGASPDVTIPGIRTVRMPDGSRRATALQNELGQLRQKEVPGHICPLNRDISLELAVVTDPGDVPHIVTLLADLADDLGWINWDERIRVRVALEEALLNAVIHGNLELSSELRERDDDSFANEVAARKQNPQFARRRVIVKMHGDEAEARWSIRDDGPGFDVRKVPDPTSPERLGMASGRGMLMMRSFMDRVTYNATGNQVELVKRNTLKCAVAETCQQAVLETVS